MVDTSGVVTLRHDNDSRLHHIGIRRAHPGTRIIMLVDDLRIRIVALDGQLLRELVLGTRRDYRPTGRPPRPTTPRTIPTWLLSPDRLPVKVTAPTS